MLLTKAAAGLALLAGLVAAHPGHNVAQEAAERRAYLSSVKRTSLSHCAEKLRARGTEARNIARRQALVHSAREKRGLKKRGLSRRAIADVLATDHNKTASCFSPNTDPATLFAGYKSCVLTPEVTQGPYYVAGEYVREDIVEDQPGIDLLLDYQVIDVATCDPVPDVYVEMWHCNSTGVYGGVIANGNGDSTDTSNIDNTWLRGIQPTNSDGVAQFSSIFPGHYTGRATHIHVMVHTNATLQKNETLGLDNYASHVGQAFFDQTLITAVSQVAPYSSITADITLNSQDSILSEEGATDGVDPLMEYTLLGSKIEDGLFAWIAFGIDTTQSSSVSPAAYLTENGGVANENNNVGGGGGAGGPGGPGGSAMPSGTAIPTGSGAPPSASASASAV